MNQEKMGKFIAYQRKKLNLTQEQLSEILNVSRTTVSKWERAITAPDISVLETLAKTLKVNVNDILCGELNSKNAPLDAIHFYNRKAKKRLIIIFAVLTTFLSLLFFLIILINNYYKPKVLNISSLDKDFLVEGLLIKYHDKESIIIKNISYNDKNVGTKSELLIKDANIKLTLNDKIISEYNLKVDDKNDINNSLNNINLYINDINTKESNLSIVIDYKTSKNEFGQFYIELKVD